MQTISYVMFPFNKIIFMRITNEKYQKGGEAKLFPGPCGIRAVPDLKKKTLLIRSSCTAEDNCGGKSGT